MTVRLLFPSPSPCEMRAVTVYFQEHLAGPWKTHPEPPLGGNQLATVSRGREGGGYGGAVEGTNSA